MKFKRKTMRIVSGMLTAIAIPIHASTAELHDRITQTKGSFSQTILGIKRLLRYGIRIEIRIVVSKVNCEDINNLAEFIIREIPQVEYISVIAMEMTGNAFKNKDRLWIPYKEAFYYASGAINKLINNGTALSFSYTNRYNLRFVKNHLNMSIMAQLSRQKFNIFIMN